jgi:hypothetical protein
MSAKIVALFHDPWKGLADAPVDWRRPGRLWRKAQWFKANPRTASYMQDRLGELWPEARFIDTDAEADWDRALDGAAQVILLYPDAIGISFNRVERIVRARANHAVLQVVNGRRRVFLLDDATARALRLRRFFEGTMLLEAIMGLVLLVATPVLLAIDLVRGRR